MEDICNELLGLGGPEDGASSTMSGHSGNYTESTSVGSQQQNSGQETNNEYFKTLSFYDDDPMDLPFESLFDSVPAAPTSENGSVPSEFSQPFPAQNVETQQEKQEIVGGVLDQVLDQVLVLDRVLVLVKEVVADQFHRLFHPELHRNPNVL